MTEYEDYLLEQHQNSSDPTPITGDYFVTEKDVKAHKSYLEQLCTMIMQEWKPRNEIEIEEFLAQIDAFYSEKKS